jgi:hypothetical protein
MRHYKTICIQEQSLASSGPPPTTVGRDWQVMGPVTDFGQSMASNLLVLLLLSDLVTFGHHIVTLLSKGAGR